MIGTIKQSAIAYKVTQLVVKVVDPDKVTQMMSGTLKLPIRMSRPEFTARLSE